MSDIINRLLGLPLAAPEEKTVELPRLGLSITLREIGYDELMTCRSSEDASFHYLLRSIVSPNFKDDAWFREQMNCPTPIFAMKKLLRPGEVEGLCRAADALNGYGVGCVLSPADKEEASLLEQAATVAAVEELEKN